MAATTVAYTARALHELASSSSTKRKRQSAAASSSSPAAAAGCAHFTTHARAFAQQYARWTRSHAATQQQHDMEQRVLDKCMELDPVDLRTELYACLSCSYTGVREALDGADHFMAHSIMANHPIALLVRKQQIYCACCRDFIYPDAKLLDSDATETNSATLSIRVDSPWRSNKSSRFHHLMATATPRRPSRRGLVNMGNTCYMNVVLQAFTHNPLLQYYFFLAKGHGSILCKQTRKQQTPPSVCLGCELGDFMATMSPATASSANSSMLASLSSPSFVPHKLLESFWNFAPSFIGSQQHDAHEFFLEFLRGLHSHTHARVSVPGGVSPRFTPTGKSLCDCAVHQHYAGVLQSQVECVVCDQVSSTFDPFLDVSLSLEDMDDGDDGQQSLALTDLLAKFTADEQLRGINRVYCRRCNAYANMLKRLRFHALPNVLVLHIKRLDFHKQRKLSRYVQFPATKLDLEEFRSEPGDACDQDPVTPRAKTQNGNKDAADASLYDLAAVINHHGDSVEGGHYTAFVQTRNENDCGNDRRKESKPQWLLFDDTDVSRVREEQVLSSQAYMLYYVRRRPRILA